MENIINNFHFLRPWLLLLLIPLFFIGYYIRESKSQSSWQKVIDKKLLDFLLIKGTAGKRHLYIWISLLGLTLAIISSAGPSFNKIEIPAYNVENPIMIVLNMSSDMNETDIAPSRLNRAKYKINDFLDLLKGVQVGLEIYSSEPFVISPLTDDAKIIQNLLPAINFDIMPANGDRLDRAIALGVEKIKSAGFKKGRLLIFTPDVGQKFDLAIEAAKKAKSENFVIDIVGVTTKTNEKLSYIADAGGGEYWNMQTDDSRILALAQNINTSIGNLKESKNLRSIWLDAGWYLIPLTLICCLLFFRKGILSIVILLMCSNASAGFFLNSDQEGLRSFNNQDFATASQQFSDTNWQAASLYKLGEYEKAYELYQKDNSIQGLYNQGNSLAKSGKIKEAIAKYEEVLAQDPNHEDAKFNLEYLKQQEKQNQNNQQNQNNENKQEQQQEQQNQEQNNQQSDQNEQQQNQDSEGNQDSDTQQQKNGSQQDDGQQDQNSENQEDNADKEKQSSMDELTPQDKQNDGKKQSGALSEQGNKEEQYDEKMQAKIQQYREIPEDPGGLLKAFIYQEYRQNRYNEQ